MSAAGTVAYGRYAGDVETIRARRGQGAAPVGPRTRHLQYAGFWSRVAASVIDGVILAVVNTAAWSVALRWTPQTMDGWASLYVWLSAILFALDLLYFAIQESSAARATLGKRALGIVVTDLEGRPLTFGRALGRHLARMFSGLTLGAGYLVAGWTARRQALHDIVAGTLVIRRSSMGASIGQTVHGPTGAQAPIAQPDSARPVLDRSLIVRALVVCLPLFTLQTLWTLGSRYAGWPTLAASMKWEHEGRVKFQAA